MMKLDNGEVGANLKDKSPSVFEAILMTMAFLAIDLTLGLMVSSWITDMSVKGIVQRGIAWFSETSEHKLIAFLLPTSIIGWAWIIQSILQTLQVRRNRSNGQSS